MSCVLFFDTIVYNLFLLQYKKVFQFKEILSNRCKKEEKKIKEGREERITHLYLQNNKDRLNTLSANLLRQRSTIFNFYVLKVKSEGKATLV